MSELPKRLAKRAFGAVGLELRRAPGPPPPPRPAPQRSDRTHLALPSHLVGLLKKLEIDCVIDAGAHWGGFGTLLRDGGYAGQIVSFEPVTATFERLRERAAEDDSWAVHRLALGATSGTVTINVTGSTDFSSILEAGDLGARLWPERTVVADEEEVEVRRLDDVLGEVVPGNPTRLFLKMDTQGYDLEVFRGAAGCIESIRGLMSELSLQPIYRGMPHYLEALENYEQAGFAVTGMYPVSRDDDWRVIEYDCVMTRVSRTQGSGE
jgi:FkbM family methyltransferase